MSDRNDAPPARAFSRGWTRGKTFAAAAVAVAAALVTLQGAVGAVSGLTRWLHARDAPTTQFERTPNLGLQFLQNGKVAPMGWQDDKGQTVWVKLDPAPFRLLAPRVAPNTAVEVCAWTNSSIFSQVTQASQTGNVPCLTPGTGAADGDYASGSLDLGTMVQNYLIGDRLQRVGDQDEVYFSNVAGPPGSQLHSLRDQTHPLFLVVYIDRNHDEKFDPTDCELVELKF